MSADVQDRGDAELNLSMLICRIGCSETESVSTDMQDQGGAEWKKKLPPANVKMREPGSGSPAFHYKSLNKSFREICDDEWGG